MELRKAENELESIYLIYESLRNSTVTSVTTGSSGYQMPSLSMIPNLNIVSDVETEVKEENKSHKTNTEVSAKEALSTLESLKNKITDLKPKADKIQKRMKEKDPITQAPRYGEKTMNRALIFCERYEAIQYAVDGILETPLEKELRQELEQQKRDAAKLEQMKQEEILAVQRQRSHHEEQEKQKRIEIERQEQIDRQREAEELSRLAEEARRSRLEAEQQAIESARQADREFVASIQKGPDGVRLQLTKLKESCTSTKDYSTAVTALHTIFSQIVAHPEEIKYRRIRRDHPKFMEDIGRHAGGKEIIVASGFKIDTVEGVSCFFSKEPDIEHDMDGWSDWYNLLKESLQIMEEALINA